MPMRLLLVPESRRDHPLALVQPGVVAYSVTVNSGNPRSFFDPSTITDWVVYEAHAPLDPSKPFWIVDTVTHEHAGAGVTNLVTAAWVPGEEPIPLVAVTLYLEGREAGHRFTMHSRAAGGPEFVASVTARGAGEAVWPVIQGGWIYDCAGNYVEVPAGSASLTASVCAGFEFWVTRDADNFSTLTALNAPFMAALTAPPGWAADYFWLAFGIFPDPPQRGPMETKHFRVRPEYRDGHSFSVQMSDGYATFFTLNSANMESIDSWDDQGIANPITVATFDAQIDPTRAWWLRDETTNENFPIGQTDVLDGWMPMHTAPPPDASIILHLPGSRRNSGFYFFYGSGNFLSLLGPGDAPESATFTCTTSLPTSCFPRRG